MGAGLIDACRSIARPTLICFRGVPENAIPGAAKLSRHAAQRTAAAGLRPPPLALLIEGGISTVNAFREARSGDKKPGTVVKLLAGLNFLGYPGIAGARSTRGVRMIRGFFRLVGLLLLAGGFIFLVYDGARSIADQALRLTRLGEFWNDIHQASQRTFQVMVEGAAPWLWNGVVKVILNQPAWAVMGVLGILLMLLFRPRKPLIGYSRN
jgi:hypothetical protein